MFRDQLICLYAVFKLTYRIVLQNQSCILLIQAQMLDYEKQPTMNNYSEINPYYLIYCNMNIRVTEEISKDSAENVVRQIGYLHNAIGFVFKDLIKILSFRFPQNNKTYKGNNSSKQSPYVHQAPININRQTQPMDIESQQGQLQSRNVRNKQRQQNQQKMMVSEPLRKDRQIQIVQNFNKQQQKPPITNIFDQYAYSKESSIQSSKNKDLTINKQNIAKVIEAVHKKKRENKINDTKDKIQKQKNRQNPWGWFENSERVSQPGLIQNLPQISGRNLVNQVYLKPAVQQEQQGQQANIFNEFLFQEKSSQPAVPPTILHQPLFQSNIVRDRNEQGQQGRLWQFMKHKQEPPIYEISDDEDE